MKTHLSVWVVLALFVGLAIGFFIRPSLDEAFGFQAAVDETPTTLVAKTWSACIIEAAQDGVITQAEFDACIAKFGKPKIYPDLGMYYCLNIALQAPPPPLPAQEITKDEYNTCFLKWWKLQGAR